MIDSRAILVLGMHRSGTSCLAGSLQEAGVYLGKVHEWNPYNKKGNRESQSVMNLHDELLAYNNMRWDALPEKGVELTWNSDLCSRRSDIIDRMSEGAANSGSIYWGFKDPRTILAYKFWADSLEKFQCVGTFRNPLDVSRSLVSRGGMTLAEGLNLWLFYNRKLLELLVEKQFPLLCFDQPSGQYQDDLQCVVRFLGLMTNKAGQRSVFFDDRLRSKSTFSFDRESLPNDVLTVYDSLYRIYSEQVI